MAYKNRLPTISRISSETRDNDFIPITELKQFDSLIEQVISKFSSIDVNDSEAINVAQKLKDIEYNLADALVFDEEGNIIDYNTDESTGNPVYGQDAVDSMLNKLTEYYNQFITLMGGDPEIDNWKYDLDRYYNQAIAELKDKVNSIFKNSANAAALEAKEDSSNNYVLKDAVKLDSNSIMRLNPDTMSYIRTVNITPKENNEDTIIADILEAEKDSLVLNIKLQNGLMFFDMNIIIDNGKIYVSNENVVSDNVIIKKGFIFKIYKYEKDNATHYVLTFAAPNTDTYNFEMIGILLAGYNFDNTGLTLVNHSNYYNYFKTSDEEPIYNKTYYTKDQDSYTEDEESEENNNRESYVPITNLLKFEEDVNYYEREIIFNELKSFDIFNDKFDGEIQNNELTSRDLVVVDQPKYNKSLKMLNVDIESREILGKNVDVNKHDYLKANKKIWPDSSSRFVKDSANNLRISAKGPYKIDNKLTMGYGETIFDVVDLRPGMIVETHELNSGITDKLYSHRYIYGIDEESFNSITFDDFEAQEILISNDDDFKFGWISSELTRYDILNHPELFNKLITVKIGNNDYSEIFNEYLKKKLVFVDSFKITLFQDADPSIVRLVILPDDTTIDNFKDGKHFYQSFAINISELENEVKSSVFVYSSIAKDPTVTTTFIDKEIYALAASNNCVVAVSKVGLYYSFDGVYWNKYSGNIDFVDSNANWKLYYDDYKYFILYNSKEIYISEDGYNWNLICDDFATNSGIEGEIKLIKNFNIDRYVIIIDNTFFFFTEPGLFDLTKPKSDWIISEYFEYMIPSGKVVDILSNRTYYFALTDTSKVYKFEEDDTKNGLNEKMVNMETIESNVNTDFVSGTTFEEKPVICIANEGNKIVRIEPEWGRWIQDITPTGFSTPFTKIVSCTDIYSDAVDYEPVSRIFLFNDNGTIIYTDDWGETWNTLADEAIDIFVGGDFDDKVIFRNTSSGLKYGNAKEKVANSDSDLIVQLHDALFAYSTQNDIEKKEYRKFVVYDSSSGCIYSSINGINWKGASISQYSPIKNIYNIPNRSINKPVTDKYGFNGFSFAVTNDRIYAKNEVDGNYVRFGADQKELHKFDFENNKVLGFGSVSSSGTELEIGENGNRTVTATNVINRKTKTIFNHGEKYMSIRENSLDTNVNHDLPENIIVEDGFETNQGIFIIGSIIIDEKIKDVVYFATTKSYTIENSYTFTKLLEVTKIDYFKPHDNDIIISAYDSEYPYVKYAYDPKTMTIKIGSNIDSNKVYTFNEVYEIDGKFFIWNGTGSNTEVDPSNYGFYQLYKSVTGDLNTSGYWDTEKLYEYDFYTEFDLIRSTEDNPVSWKIPMFRYGESYVFSFCQFSQYADSKHKFIGFIPTTELVYEMDRDELYDLNTIIQNEDNKFARSYSNIHIDPNYNICVQDKNAQYFDYLENPSSNKLANQDNFIVDKYYFDKENISFNFNTFEISQSNNRFILTSEKIALGTTIKTNNTNIVVSLSQDCKVAVYDKTVKMLKTVGFKYIQIGSNAEAEIELDPDKFLIHSLNIGSSNTDNNIYLVIHGKFPRVILNNSTNEIEADYNVESSYKLFKVTCQDILNSEDEIVTLEWCDNYDIQSEDGIPTGAEIKNYISAYQLQVPSNDLELSLINDIQFIGIHCGVLYSDTESIAYWNTKSKSIDIVTKVNIDSSLKTIIEIDPKQKELINVCNTIDTDFKIYRDKDGKLAAKDLNQHILTLPIQDCNIDIPYIYARKGLQSYIDGFVAHRNLGLHELEESESLENNMILLENKNKQIYDLFNDSAINPYEKMKQTNIGLFRYSLDNIHGERKNHSYSELENVSINSSNNQHNAYFTVDNHTVILRAKANSKITGIYETYDSVLITTSDWELIDLKQYQTHKCYRLKNIPVESEIQIGDERYFESIGIDDYELTDIVDTDYGIFAVGKCKLIGNQFGLFGYNEDGFYPIKVVENQNTDKQAVYSYIIETDDSKLLLGTDGYNFTSGERIDIGTTSMKQVDLVDFNVIDSSTVNDSDLPGVIRSKEITNFLDNNILSDLGNIIVDPSSKKIVNAFDSTDSVTISKQPLWVPLTKRIVESSSEIMSSSFKNIADMLVEKGVPVNTDVKVIGSIIFNNTPVSVTSLRIIKNGGKVLTVSFSIDKEYRLPNELFTSENGEYDYNFTNGNSNNEYSQFTKKGIICDYDVVNLKHLNLKNTISKCNFTVVFDVD